MTDEQIRDDVLDEDGSELESASDADIVNTPRNWDKAVSAAYLWLLADEIKAAAKGAGVGERTLQRWVRSPWWADACAEAEHRWMRHLTAESRRTVMKSIREGNADLAMRILERMDARLAPPAKKLEVRMSIQQLMASLSAEEIRRLRAMPEEDRRTELQRLLGPGGLADG